MLNNNQMVVNKNIYNKFIKKKKKKIKKNF